MSTNTVGGIASGELSSSQPAHRGRRYFLIGATAAIGGVGAIAAAVPFVQSWLPSAKARAAGAPVRVDISKLRPGEMLGPIPAWRGKPVFVVRRGEDAVKRLEENSSDLADPASDNLGMPPASA